jgi:hypothetical protein
MNVPRLKSAHKHRIEGPVIVIHSPGVVTHENLTEMPMHAFGPFEDEVAAHAWYGQSILDGIDDKCEKVIIEIYAPEYLAPEREQ